MNNERSNGNRQDATKTAAYKPGEFSGDGLYTPDSQDSYDPYYNSASYNSASGDYYDSGSGNRPLPGYETGENQASVTALKRMNAALIAIVGIAVAALFVILVFLLRGRIKKPPVTTHTAGTAAGEAASAALDSTAAAEGTSATSPSAPAATAAPAKTESWQNAPADRLYRPEDLFIDQHAAWVCCTDVDVQDYVKMRLGPSKSHFNTTGVTIDNFNKVTVETGSLNGWTLCFYNGVEGWIRSDFLFGSEAAARAAIGAPQVSSAPTETAVPGLHAVNVTGEYAGEPLNLRASPTKDSDLLAKLAQGTLVNIPEGTPVQNGWVFVEVVAFSETDSSALEVLNTGYVLYKYLRPEGVGDKPVLYLYPEKTQNVDVKINLDKNVAFSCTYPAYNNGWRVTAQPDGTLTDRDTGKEYAYLYWELCGKADYRFDKGFAVKGSDTAEFLEKTLTQIGLNARERNEFIVYWLPRLQNNPYNLISFQTDAYTSLVDLQISPAPDSLLRVFMAYRPLQKPVKIEPQTFAPFARNGFTAVEWGGAEVR